MGYTHYWYRKQVLDQAKYQSAVDDFNKIMQPIENMGIKLGNGLGENKPVIDYDNVIFNGLVHCGHLVNTNIAIPWPADNASGLGDSTDAIDGEWFAGASVNKRCCDGDCSYETFSFPRVFKPEKWQKPEDEISHYYNNNPIYNKTEIIGMYFDCCKTAFRSYDIAVTAFLIIAKHYFGNDVIVRSDGKIPQWQDAMVLCQLDLGYGLDFKLD